MRTTSEILESMSLPAISSSEESSETYEGMNFTTTFDSTCARADLMLAELQTTEMEMREKYYLTCSLDIIPSKPKHLGRSEDIDEGRNHMQELRLKIQTARHRATADYDA